MTEYDDTTTNTRSRAGGRRGVILFAGNLMIMIGGFHAIAGLVALLQDSFYVVAPNYLFEFDVTTWGWIHLIAGIMVVFAGFGVMSGQTWARVVGIMLAVLSAFANFGFIPYYPVWSLLIIALDVFVIWALATHGREMAS